LLNSSGSKISIHAILPNRFLDAQDHYFCKLKFTFSVIGEKLFSSVSLSSNDPAHLFHAHKALFLVRPGLRKHVYPKGNPLPEQPKNRALDSDMHSRYFGADARRILESVP
jgi:hypothetical protein